MSKAIEKQKNALFSNKTGDEEKPLIASLWEILVGLMILYFVMSIVNSLVQNYLSEEDTHDEEKTKKKD